MKKTEKKRAWRSNIIYGVFLALAILFTVNVNAKAWLIRGLMKTGLFQISMPDKATLGSAETQGKEVPDAAFEDAQGREVHLSSLKGKVVFINFWATWCPPCIAEMPTINALYKRLKENKQVIFLLVDVDGNKASAKAFMDKNDYELPVYTSVGDIPPEFLGGGIPTTVIINKAGALMIKHEGAANYADPEVEKLLLELADR